MSDTQTLKNLQNLLEEKYQPILVVQLLRVPPQDELTAFAQKLSADFGYKVLVLPGDIETKVELISVLKSETVELETIQNKVLTLITELEKEHESVLQPVGLAYEEKKIL
jgi:hypothetical protein